MNRREVLQRTAMVLGYAVTGPALIGLMNGCKTKPALNYKPVFFNEEQAGVISEIAEVIIPKTKTPGAKDTGVPAFIDGMLKEVFPKVEQERFLAGLEAFNQDAKKAYGDSFPECTPEQQKALVTKYNAEAINGMSKDKPFILVAKELTLIGFFTSQPGATEVLQYEQVPGPYQGCVPLSQVGKTWAT